MCSDSSKNENGLVLMEVCFEKTIDVQKAWSLLKEESIDTPKIRYKNSIKHKMLSWLPYKLTQNLFKNEDILLKFTVSSDKANTLHEKLKKYTHCKSLKIVRRQ